MRYSDDNKTVGPVRNLAVNVLKHFLYTTAAMGIAFPLFGQDPTTDSDSVSMRLNCHISGILPIPPTDTETFKGSGAWARVGINRKLGGVATTLELINPDHPEMPLSLIDNRSAAGAAWQSCVGTVDAQNEKLVGYNQSCGNSDQNWGFESSYDISDTTGFVQKQWLPLFSVGYKQPANPGGTVRLTSPCPVHISKTFYPPIRLGDGKFSIVPQMIQAGAAKILRLTDTYMVRLKDTQAWKQFDFDQCLYLTPAAVQEGDLRAYLAQEGHSIVGPIHLSGEIPVSLRKNVRSVVGDNEDWFISTLPASYVILVYHVAGKDIGIAIHQTNKRAFTGFLRYRPHIFSGILAREGQSSHQWHFSLRSGLDPSLKKSFSAGEISTYSVQYDIAPLDQLAAEGFPL